MDSAANYRRHGALLSMGPVGAAFLASRHLASPDPMGNRDGLIGMSVPNDKVNCHIGGENPVLSLVGGVMIGRDDGTDVVIGVFPVSIDGLFDEEEA